MKIQNILVKPWMNNSVTMTDGKRLVWLLLTISMHIRVRAHDPADSIAWHVTPSESHPCRRPCTGKTMTCYYTLNVESYYALSKACKDCPNNVHDCYRKDCVSVDGVPRSVVLVNRQLPGPSIEMCLGDKLVVDLHNKMDDCTTSIHWHGHHQVDTPYMDGVPFVTQCPVGPNSVFRYTMHASHVGTHFWHGHTGVDRDDGMFGPLIIRQVPKDNPHSSLYDHDLSDHIVAVNDWTHVSSKEKLLAHLHGRGNNKPDSLLVNGRGRHFNDSVPLTNTPFTVFNVEQGYRYRFRLINSGVHNCPQDLTIDNHNITAIASDGYDIEPVTVGSLVSYAGERWDFVLHANQPVGNYWLRFTGLMDCDERFTKAHQLAILHYEGADHKEPPGLVGYNVHPKPTLQLNSVNVANDQPGTISVPDLSAINKSVDHHLLQEKPDCQFYLTYDFNAVDHPKYHKSGAYGFHEVDSKFRQYTPQFNHISMKFPPMPLLSQYKEIDNDLYCANQNLKNCSTTFCQCINIISIAMGSIVEMILIDEGMTFDANHPFHLHGYSFVVVGMDRLGTSVHVEEVKELDRAGKLERNLKNPPSKDTVTVPDGGYTILRFHATNPGYWLFHCHIESHLHMGMAVVFKVGEDYDIPKVPKGFPPCGNFIRTTA